MNSDLRRDWTFFVSRCWVGFNCSSVLALLALLELAWVSRARQIHQIDPELLEVFCQQWPLETSLPARTAATAGTEGAKNAMPSIRGNRQRVISTTTWATEFPRHFVRHIRSPAPQTLLARSSFCIKVCLPITLLQVLAVRVGSSFLSHLEVDIPWTNVDLSNNPPIPVFDLGFKRDGLVLNQPLQVLGRRPSSTFPLSNFRNFNTRKTSRDLLSVTSRYPNCVAVINWN